MSVNNMREDPTARIRRSELATGERKSNSKILEKHLRSVQVHTSRKVQAMGRTEGDVEGCPGRKGADGKGWEGRRPSRRERRNEDGVNGARAVKRRWRKYVLRACACFSGFPRERERERKRGIWRRWRQPEYLKGARLQKNTCYGARTPLK